MEAYTVEIALNPKFRPMIREVQKFDDYNDTEELIKHFLRCSTLNDWSNFDFEAAFDTIRTPIKQKLAEHGLLELKDYIEYMEDLVCPGDIEKLESSWGIDNNYVYLSGNEIYEAILKCQYDKMRETFESYDTFKDIKEIYDKIERSYNNSLQENINLFDSCIHAEHVNGNILCDFCDIDIDSLKSDVESELE